MAPIRKSHLAGKISMTQAEFDLKSYLLSRQQLVDVALTDLLKTRTGLDAVLHEAMHYSVFAGGKRLRPILCMAAAEAVGGSAEAVLPIGCAIEYIHTYSLIHDDLPVMDDDDLRRGRPTSHKVFGEALALLAGDGLLTDAFAVLTLPEMVARFSAPLLLQTIHIVARAAGSAGMVAGQVVDVRSEGRSADLATVEFIHRHKTAALITAPLAAGALLGGGTDQQVDALTDYGQKIGLAFQISDDILDILGDTATLGKKVGADAQRGKVTYPGVVGLPQAQAVQADLVDKAIALLAPFGPEARPLRALARYIIERNR